MEGRAAAHAAARPPFEIYAAREFPRRICSFRRGLPRHIFPSDQSLLKRSHAFVRKPETGKAASMMQTIYRICCMEKLTSPQPL